MRHALDPWTRRRFFQIAGMAGAGVALGSCASEPESPGEQGGGETPSPVFKEPATKLSGELSILLWSHFVPSHDQWFDTFVEDWGSKVGVDVRVDHVDVANIPTQVASEIQAKQGHDILQYIATLSEFESGVLDLTDVTDEATNRHGEQLGMCRESSYNPHTDKFYAFAPGWVPDPGNFRKSLWEPVGFPDGPATWDELLEGASEIKRGENVPVGLGMSQEIDSNKVLAMILVADFRGKWVVRFLVLLPWTTPVALSSVTWLWLLHSIYSPIDWVLRNIGLIEDNSYFLGRPGLAMGSIIAVHVWRLVPLAAVIMMVGILSIPDDIIEASRIDGAGFWRRLFEVTIPLTFPLIAVAALFGAIFTFTDMAVVFVLTGGGPTNSTHVLASWSFVRGIGGGDIGQGAVIALFLFPLLLAAAILILRAVRRMETI